MERLPPDLLVCSALTGFDVFRLSQTSAAVRRATDTDRQWRDLLDCGREVEETETDADAQQTSARLWKKEYVRARSLQFHGLPLSNTGRNAYVHGSFVELRGWSSAFTRHFGPRAECTSVSIDLWFSLLPRTGETEAGGILFGLQSTSATSHLWPYYHQQPIVVDSNRRLFASLLDNGGQPVGPTLDVNRWYHLALTYSGQYREEKVYLDGKLALERSGDWHHEWRQLVNAQVGSGCVTAGGRCLPTPGYIGWYGFHGTVDEFRIWEGDLLPEEVARLASGVALRDETALWCSLRSATAMEGGGLGIRLVRCTRPVERTFEQM